MTALDGGGSQPRRDHVPEGALAEVVRRLRGQTDLVAEPKISRRASSDIARCSHQQLRIWIQERLSPGTAAQNIAACYRITGMLRRRRLEDAWHGLLERHSVLRSSFTEIGGEPYQRIHPHVESPVAFVDVSALSSAAREGAVRSAMTDLAATPFGDLATPPLARCALIRTSEVEHLFVLVVHHVIADGWSLGLIVAELRERYAGVAPGPATSAPALEYADYAEWQGSAGYLRAAERHRAYWERALRDEDAFAAFPADRASFETRIESSRISCTVASDVVRRLRRVAADERASDFMTFASAFGVLAAAHGCGPRSLVTVPFANRTMSETAAMIGCFVNPVITPVVADPRSSFRDALRETKRTTLEILEHQDYAFTKVFEMTRKRHRERLEQLPTMFAWQNAPRARTVGDGLRWSSYPLETGSAQFDLTFLLEAVEDAVRIDLVYGTSRFDASTAERILARFVHVLGWLSVHPDEPLSSADSLPANERAWILDAGRGAPVPAAVLEETLCDRFFRQAALTPDAVALVCDGRTLTYGRLAAEVRRTGRGLVARGVTPGSRVALAMRRSEALAVAVLATMSVGAACVLIDPALPALAVAERLETAKADFAFVDSEDHAALSATRVIAITPKQLETAAGAGEGGEPVAATPSSLAYIIFTSGSSGPAKGVMVEHASLYNLLLARIDSSGLTPADRVLHTIAFSFDPSLWQLLGPLLAGATVVLTSDDARRDPKSIARLLREHHITITDFVPSMLGAVLEAIDDDSLGSLRLIYLGGEVLSRTLLDALRMRSTARVFNQYGPTECTIDALAWPADGKRDVVPIGRPTRGQWVVICDESLSLVPIGVPGQICISGAGVARGYAGDESSTAARFVTAPEWLATDQRLYLTGDIGRLCADGNFEFLGRMDRQIKVNGHRVEPGEIENVLLAAPGVTNARVVIAPDAGGAGHVLTAHVMVDDASSAASGALRTFLAKRLPGHMIPSRYVVHATFPTTSSGKVDEAALAATQPASGLHAAGPRSPSIVLDTVAAVWQSVLGLERCGVDDDFFMLGGTSLHAIRVVTVLQRVLEVELAVSALFATPVLSSFAREVARARSKAHRVPAITVAGDADKSGDFPLSWPQRWACRNAFSQWTPEQEIFIPVIAEGDVSADSMRAACGTIVGRFDALRTALVAANGRTVQRVVSNERAYEEWRCDDADVLRKSVEELVQHIRGKPLDVRSGQSFKLTAVQLSARRTLFAFAFHKGLVDGVAAEAAVAEVFAAYDAIQEGRTAEEKSLRAQPFDLVRWERDWMTDAVADALVADALARAADAPPLALSRAASGEAGPVAYREVARFADDEARHLRNAAASLGATPFVLFLAALQQACCRLTGQPEFLIGMPVSCRDDDALDGAVLRAVNMAAVRCEVAPNAPLSDQVKGAWRTVRDAYDVRHAPYLRVHQELRERTESPQPVTTIVNYVGRTDAVRAHGLVLTPVAVEQPWIDSPLTVLVGESEHGYQAAFLGRRDGLSAERLRVLRDSFAGILLQGTPLARADADPGGRW